MRVFDTGVGCLFTRAPLPRSLCGDYDFTFFSLDQQATGFSCQYVLRLSQLLDKRAKLQYWPPFYPRQKSQIYIYKVKDIYAYARFNRHNNYYKAKISVYMLSFKS